MNLCERRVLVTCPFIGGKPLIRDTNIAALEEVGLSYEIVHPGMSMEQRRTARGKTSGTLRTGGLDIHPKRFRQRRNPRCDIPDEARDEMEAMIVGWDLENGRPSINTCLGL